MSTKRMAGGERKMELERGMQCYHISSAELLISH